MSDVRIIAEDFVVELWWIIGSYSWVYYPTKLEAEKAAREISVVYPAVAYIMEYFARNYGRDIVIEAAKESYNDTGISLEDTIDILNKWDFDLETSDFLREFQIVLRITVEVCMTIEATDEDDAEEQAKSLLEDEGIEQYNMEYSVWYDADVTSVEEGY